MPTLTVVVGYCGAGKTWWLDQRKGERPDAFFMNEGAQTYPGGGLHASVSAALKGGQDCFVGLMDCAHATNRAALLASVAKIGDVTIKWVFFENRADKANENCRRDPSRTDVAGNIAQNERWSAAYDIPAEAEVLEIFAIAKPSE